MALLVTGATYAAAGFDRFRRPDVVRAGGGPVPAGALGGPRGQGMSATTAEEHFFDNGTEHRWHWYVHVAVAVLAMGGSSPSCSSRVARRTRGRATWWLAAGAAPLVAIGIMLAVALPPMRRAGGCGSARLAAAGAAMLGVLLLGGVASAAPSPSSARVRCRRGPR